MTRLHMEEMVEEALVAGDCRSGGSLRCIPEEPERGQRQVARIRPTAPAALDPDRVGGQREPDRGDAREGGRWPAVGNQPVGPVHRLPEKAERALLDVLVECGQRGPGPRCKRGSAA